MYDIVIKNGMYPDFSEGKFKLDDVAVKDGKIVKIGSIFEESTITIDATDRIISPGFIDIHMHEERFLQNGKKYDITVATSDRLEQMIIWGAGAKRLSAAGLKEEVEAINQEINSHLEQKVKSERNYLFDQLKDKKNEILEELQKEK